MTFLGVISWLSLCLILAGLFPQASANFGTMWVMAGLFGLAAAVGLQEAAKAELRAQNDLLSDYLSEARTDALTGLGNRRAFDCHWQASQSDRRAGREFALLLIDVDRFKSFNDRFGHQAGDEMLRAVAQVLQEQVGRVGVACRYGGEEFAVIIPDVDLSEAMAWAETVRESIAKRTVTFRMSELSVTVSIGIAMTQEGDTADKFVTRADEQLYAAKADGRNCTRPRPDQTADIDPLLATIHPTPTLA